MYIAFGLKYIVSPKISRFIIIFTPKTAQKIAFFLFFQSGTAPRGTNAEAGRFLDLLAQEW